jgi:hypothetical protein
MKKQVVGFAYTDSLRIRAWLQLYTRRLRTLPIPVVWNLHRKDEFELGKSM